MKKELTEIQLSLWAGQKMNPGIPLHNTAYSFEIRGVLDVKRFKKAFQSLINEADAFRIIFFEEYGKPYQSAQSKLLHELEYLDISSKLEDTSLEDWVLERSGQSLDLTRQAFDSALLKVAENRFIWFLNMHHLATDAISLRIIFDKMARLYGHDPKAMKEEEEEKMPSFIDYVELQSQQDNAEAKSENEYWNGRMNDLRNIPLLYAGPGEKITDATRVTLKLGQERSEKLKALTADPQLKGLTEQLTLFNLIASLLFTYLYRVSGQNKFTIGAPTHNRLTENSHKTVGCFIEIFPLAMEFSKNDTFYSVLQRVKLEAIEYLNHSQRGKVPLEVRSSFNVLLNYINTSFSNFNGAKTKAKWIFPGHMDPGHQMRCHVMNIDATGEIEILLDLNHGTFDQNLRKKAPQHLLNLLDALLQDIHTNINQPEICTAEEKASFSEEPLPKEAYQHFYKLFTESVGKNPKAIALKFGREELTYQALNEKVKLLASRLKQQNLKAGDRVGLYFFRSPEYIVSVLAAVRLGLAFVPIASDQPVERILYILENSGCSLVLADIDLSNKIADPSIPTIPIDLKELDEAAQNETHSYSVPANDEIAYILYTSGSTGNPKGVMISHGALSNYLCWASTYYKKEEPFIFPLFTSIGFDLTITSTFLPLISGGELVIQSESVNGPDIALVQVLKENKVNAIKLTPSHLNLIVGMNLESSNINTIIVGGEDFRTSLAKDIEIAFGKKVAIFNEYGPTEAAVGCIASKFNSNLHLSTSVPIGKPITNTIAYVLDERHNLVPQGVTGELYLSGVNISEGYVNMPDLTKEKFIENPFLPNFRMYRSGDRVRWNTNGSLEYLGRIDEQVKLNGFRIELQDIEANLSVHPSVENTAVVLTNHEAQLPEEVINCQECGLPSNYPNTDFDENGICHLCNAFKGYREKAHKYFKTEKELKLLLTSKKDLNNSYDCISLLSGGKDSTYVLAKLVNMGLRVLAFTLDNGYISEQAKSNIDTTVEQLGVDHIYGETPHMNQIFVDSLHRHHNVCNGCFKTIYTLSTKIALENNIPFVITGLSRGQFFETRLTEELFWDDSVDTTTIDQTILEARKLYHKQEDAVMQLLDVSMFRDESTFKKVQFVDFYRYSDVSLGEMLQFLKEKVNWIRPTDTGRSTNCLINQVGIYVHKREKGYSNYSFPYSWDVRLGHKTREETLEEINEYIEENEVKRIMKEIGYQPTESTTAERKRLVGYYTGPTRISSRELTSFLSKKLPYYMIPAWYKHLEELPLTNNGKVNKKALRSLSDAQIDLDTPYVAPRNEIEELVEKIWKEVLQLKQVGVHDDFISLGGHSLAAIRVTARINDELELDFPLNKIFEFPTIAEYAKFIEETLVELLGE